MITFGFQYTVLKNEGEESSICLVAKLEGQTRVLIISFGLSFGYVQSSIGSKIKGKRKEKSSVSSIAIV
jgi:hypothetical protein